MGSVRRARSVQGGVASWLGAAFNVHSAAFARSVCGRPLRVFGALELARLVGSAKRRLFRQYAADGILAGLPLLGRLPHRYASVCFAGSRSAPLAACLCPVVCWLHGRARWRERRATELV